MVCDKCGAPVVFKERLDFPSGPAKLVYECTGPAHHVTIMDAESAPASTELATESPPLDLSQELGQERISKIQLSPDHTSLSVEAESGNRLVVSAREGGRLKVEWANQPAPPQSVAIPGSPPP